MDWNSQMISLVNFHTMPTGNLWPRWVWRTFENRESDLLALADFAKTQSAIGPLIVAGDANATRLNDAYKSVAAVLKDTWLEAGFGLGHSFPGPIEEGGSSAQISFFRIPYWMVGIDYIFTSHEFDAVDTWMGAFYGGSDHRAVVSDLVLKGSP
jgi:endonuclease/exonuclease/phosphatase (EEP) superfamily protein YafD